MAPTTTGATPSPTLANSTLPASPPPDIGTTTPSPLRADSPSGLYTPLDKKRKEIRLLEIVSINPQLEFTLHVKSLNTRPAFSALSYRWGGEDVTIIVNGKEMNVAKNLVDAVKDIHHHLIEPVGGEQPRRLWADAVCINQSDSSEKSQQVPLMKKIYTQAKQVLSWLGPATESTKTAFNTLRLLIEGVSAAGDNKLEWMKNHDNLCREPLSVPPPQSPWLKTMNLLQCDYWHRVWIFQELFLGDEVLLNSGSESLAFNHLIRLSKDLPQALNAEDRPEFFSTTTWLEFIQFSGMLRLLLKPILDFRDRVRDLRGQEQYWVEILVVFPLFRHALHEFGASEEITSTPFLDCLNLPSSLITPSLCIWSTLSISKVGKSSVPGPWSLSSTGPLRTTI